MRLVAELVDAADRPVARVYAREDDTEPYARLTIVDDTDPDDEEPCGLDLNPLSVTTLRDALEAVDTSGRDLAGP